MGLEATLRLDASRNRLEFRLDSGPSSALDQQLVLHFFHSTRAGRDRTVLGALAGIVGAGISELNPLSSFPLGTLIAAIFMVALGMYLANWWRILSVLEDIGAIAWRKIEPWGRRWLPVGNPFQAFGLGVIWGWLPCGLVYAVVAWSLTTGDIQQGAMLMLGFGLGTLPTLILMGSAAVQLKHLFQSQVVRTTAGIIIIVFGVYTGYMGLTQQTPIHHSQPSSQSLLGYSFSARPALRLYASMLQGHGSQAYAG
ncbi:MAG: sulfite exporter TauE/SafE family protein [Proteobacteria bacterium]|nr:sulfite exporter TauE/SafE family protein [Pseudomonadota bacterium]MCH8178133.1 sulfite exporter TauE/SafE family protein [Pseudomonadota bacterium]